MDSSDAWRDALFAIGGLVCSVLLSIIAHFARKADKKLDQVVDVQGKHAELFASVLERNRNPDERISRIDNDQERQWEAIKEQGDRLGEQGQTLAAHGESIQFLKTHPALLKRT